jgi:uncharacterized repeat protein (TIGR01451 family)
LLLRGALATVALVVLTWSAAPGAHAAKVARSPGRAARPASTPTADRHLPTVPGLTISITDGRTQARPGDRLSYTVHVRDDGSAAARNLRITLTLPSYLRFISAGQRARVTDGQVSWRSSLGPGQVAAFRMRALLARTPPGIARLAAVACASAGGGKTVVCASHLDALPGAGRVERAASKETASRTAARMTSGRSTRLILAGLAALTIAVLILYATRRTRVRRPKGQWPCLK